MSVTHSQTNAKTYVSTSISADCTSKKAVVSGGAFIPQNFTGAGEPLIVDDSGTQITLISSFTGDCGAVSACVTLLQNANQKKNAYTISGTTSLKITKKTFDTNTLTINTTASGTKMTTMFGTLASTRGVSGAVQCATDLTSGLTDYTVTVTGGGKLKITANTYSFDKLAIDEASHSDIQKLFTSGATPNNQTTGAVAVTRTTYTPTSGQLPYTTVTATLSGSQSKFNISDATSSHGVSDIVVDASVAAWSGIKVSDPTGTGGTGPARVNAQFNVPAQTNCSNDLKNDIDNQNHPLYDDLDCVLVPQGTHEILRCIANSATFSDQRRHKFLQIAPFDLRSGPYETMQMSDGSRYLSNNNAKCRAKDEYANTTDLEGRDGDNDKYCVRKYTPSGSNEELIRLSSYVGLKHSGNGNVWRAAARAGEKMLLDSTDAPNTLTEKCQWADEIVVPDSVRYLGVGFMISMESDVQITAGTNIFTIYVGERLQRSSPTPGSLIYVPAIDDTATMLANDGNNVAVIRRRCPTNIQNANHPGFLRVTDTYKNTFTLNTIASKVMADRDKYDESSYYDMSTEEILNCVSRGE